MHRKRREAQNRNLLSKRSNDGPSRISLLSGNHPALSIACPSWFCTSSTKHAQNAERGSKSEPPFIEAFKRSNDGPGLISLLSGNHPALSVACPCWFCTSSTKLAQKEAQNRNLLSKKIHFDFCESVTRWAPVRFRCCPGITRRGASLAPLGSAQIWTKHAQKSPKIGTSF